MQQLLNLILVFWYNIASSDPLLVRTQTVLQDKASMKGFLYFCYRLKRNCVYSSINTNVIKNTSMSHNHNLWNMFLHYKNTGIVTLVSLTYKQPHKQTSSITDMADFTISKRLLSFFFSYLWVQLVLFNSNHTPTPVRRRWPPVSPSHRGCFSPEAAAARRRKHFSWSS